MPKQSTWTTHTRNWIRRPQNTENHIDYTEKLQLKYATEVKAFA